MVVKLTSAFALLGLLLVPAASIAKDMTIQERLDNVRAARALFFELDDIHRSYKRAFSGKDKNKMETDLKKIRNIRDKLNDLPSNTPGGAGDIIFDCRDVRAPLYVWISDKIKRLPQIDQKNTKSEYHKDNQIEKSEEIFLIVNNECISLMNEKEQHFLKQLGKK